MVATKRTLLVVEDEVVLNEVYTDFCQIALQELSAEGLPIEGTIEQAFNYSQAKDILERQTVDFISIDIALSEQEERLTEERRKGREPGGMHLLRELQEAERQPISVVLTGETLQSYALDAWRVYRVLAFYQKDEFDADKYKNAIKAALWYWDAADLIAEPETELDIDAAKESWQKALKAAKIAGIEERDFPATMRYRIKSKRDELTHSVTRLPIGHWTEDKLRSEVVGCEDWALIRMTIKGFKEFVAALASQEEPILNSVAGLLKRARVEFEDQRLFIGHLGHLDYTPEPGFVVLPSEKSVDRIADMARWIENEFEKKAGLFAPAFSEDRANQQELTLAVEAKVLTSVEHTFPDLHHLLDILGSSQL
jgi:DNA-binding NarL/FixJ family response regulator